MPDNRGEPEHTHPRRVGVQPEPDSTPRRETLRNRWRIVEPLTNVIRASASAAPDSGTSVCAHERLPQIGSALAAEVAAVADLRPELLGV